MVQVIVAVVLASLGLALLVATRGHRRPSLLALCVLALVSSGALLVDGNLELSLSGRYAPETLYGRIALTLLFGSILVGPIVLPLIIVLCSWITSSRH